MLPDGAMAAKLQEPLLRPDPRTAEAHVAKTSREVRARCLWGVPAWLEDKAENQAESSSLQTGQMKLLRQIRHLWHTKVIHIDLIAYAKAYLHFLAG